VGIGDGANVGLLPDGVRITGVDIAWRRLLRCRDRHTDRPLRLALAEAERLPFADGSFDAVLCVGGFNYFSDPAKALREMARVTRREGRVVVADEIVDLFRYGWGHLLRIPSLDDRLMRHWFGEEFREMIVTNDLDITQVGSEHFEDACVHRIWRGYGYCLVGSPPKRQ
jgi:SAM-dependent methyltransferase